MIVPSAETIETLRQAHDREGLIEYADLHDLKSRLTDAGMRACLSRNDDSAKDSILVRTGTHTDLFA